LEAQADKAAVGCGRLTDRHGGLGGRHPRRLEVAA
jgi:hypothetical protein